MSTQRARDAGAVTAELAVGMVAVVCLLAVVLLAAGAGAARLRCQDAAAAGARVLALHRSDGEAAAAARRIAGADVGVAIARSDGWAEVVVTGRARGAWFTSGPLAVSGSATAWVEP